MLVQDIDPKNWPRGRESSKLREHSVVQKSFSGNSDGREHPLRGLLAGLAGPGGHGLRRSRRFLPRQRVFDPYHAERGSTWFEAVSQARSNGIQPGEDVLADG